MGKKTPDPPRVRLTDGEWELIRTAAAIRKLPADDWIVDTLVIVADREIELDQERIDTKRSRRKR